MTFLTEAANRGSVSTGYEIANSLLLEGSDSGMNFNHQQMTTGGDDQWAANANAGTNTKKATISMWIKRSALSPSSGNGQHMRLFHFITGGTATSLYLTNDKINMYDDSTSAYLVSNRLLRDLSAWYHIVLAMDSTQSTAANRVKIYINGVQETSWSTEDYGNQNAVLGMFSNSHVTWILGAAGSNNGQYTFNGYMAEVHLIDGEQKAATDFGEFDSSGIWVPIEYEGNYGTLGAYYNFEDTSNNRFNDESGNGNFMDNRGGSFEGKITTDTPTNNFNTLNSLIPYAVQSGTPEITYGQTKHNGSGGWTGMKGTIGVNKGKWYWELSTNSGTGAELIHGIQTVTSLSTSGESTATSAHNLLETAAWYVNGGHWIKDETSGRDDIAAGSITQTYGNSVIHAVALNMDDGEITYYANGSVVSGLNQVDLDGLAGETVAPFASVYNQQVLWNFGGYTSITISSAASDANGYGTFEYAPPSGYYALCSKNLAEFG